MNTIPLPGCAPVPLAHYLKALGVLRLVSEQKDRAAKGCWQGDTFVLHSTVDQSGLVEFFLNDYQPTPVVAPWNGGSGFYPNDNRDAIEAIVKGKANRLGPYREAINAAERVLVELGIKEKVTKEQKTTLLEGCRNRLSDDVVKWLDAAFVLTEGGPQYPPLLGTGGNDGRLDFTNNFMQRLLDVFTPDTGERTALAEQWLRLALFGEPTAGLRKGAIGQFFPSAAGGANSESGFASASLLNPWDFALMIEGSLVFASASVKRLESTVSGSLSAPFCVRQAGVGYASASLADENDSRPELWAPLWPAPSGLNELRALIGEGRAQLAGRPARNGVDFARAIASLGVDRGISAFQRYGFQVRNGLAYFATPLDRLPVRRNLQVDLLNDVDAWLDSFRTRGSGNNAPASASRVLAQLESAVVALCKQGDPSRVQAVLVELGGCERVMARSLKWSTANFLRPVQPLSPRWLVAADDGSAEYRLAASAASVSGRYGERTVALRSQLEPVKTGASRGRLWVNWDEPASANVAWHDGDVVEALNAVMAKRLVLAIQSGAHAWPDAGRRFARLSDVAAFVEGRLSLRRFAELLLGLTLLDWAQVPSASWPARDDAESLPGATFALLKLCYPSTTVRGAKVPLVAEIDRHAIVGDGSTATRLAARRLRASGLPPAVEQVYQQGESVRRAAAALLFPLAGADLDVLADAVLRPRTQNL